MTSARGAIWLLAAAAVASLAPTAAAHPAAADRLQLLSQRIAADPVNAGLFLERGHLHRQQNAWDAALADYQQAAELGLDPDAVDLARGELLLQAGRPAAAEVFLDRLIARRGDHPRALTARARARSASGRPAAAADDYRRALARSPRPTPDFYLEVIRALERAGRDEEALARADEGLERLGPVGALAAAAVEIEVANARYELALERLDSIAAGSSLAGKWHVRRAEVLELAGRPAEARTAYEETLEILARHAVRRGSNPTLKGLEQRIRSGLERLEDRPQEAGSADRRPVTPST